jgi:hypothetical protein
MYGSTYPQEAVCSRFHLQHALAAQRAQSKTLRSTRTNCETDQAKPITGNSRESTLAHESLAIKAKADFCWQQLDEPMQCERQ